MSLDNTQLLCLALDNLRQQIKQALLLRRPPKQLVRPDGLAARIRAPEVASRRRQLVCVRGAQTINLSRVDEFLLVGYLCNRPGYVAPDKVAVFGKVVAVRVPGCFASVGRQRGCDKGEEDLA